MFLSILLIFLLNFFLIRPCCRLLEKLAMEKQVNGEGRKEGKEKDVGSATMRKEEWQLK